MNIYQALSTCQALGMVLASLMAPRAVGTKCHQLAAPFTAAKIGRAPKWLSTGKWVNKRGYIASLRGRDDELQVNVCTRRNIPSSSSNGGGESRKHACVSGGPQRCDANQVLFRDSYRCGDITPTDQGMTPKREGCVVSRRGRGAKWLPMCNCLVLKMRRCSFCNSVYPTSIKP